MSAFRLIAAATLVAASTAAWAQQNTNIRGTVSAFDGKVITIKSNAGQDVSVDMPENVVPSITKAFTMADVKPGMKLGVTTIKRGDQTIAIDVRPISAQAPEGLSDYDLQPQSTMTNAIADAVVTATGGNEITLNYKTGVVKVLVPPGTPMSQAAPGQRADVKAGETIFVAARNEGGKLTAVRVQVSKDGVKPTQ